MDYYNAGLKHGAKWMKEQILNQDIMDSQWAQTSATKLVNSKKDTDY
jgi:hypothetical protein